MRSFFAPSHPQLIGPHYLASARTTTPHSRRTMSNPDQTRPATPNTTNHQERNFKISMSKCVSAARVLFLTSTSFYMMSIWLKQLIERQFCCYYYLIICHHDLNCSFFNFLFLQIVYKYGKKRLFFLLLLHFNDVWFCLEVIFTLFRYIVSASSKTCTLQQQQQ